MPKSSTFLLLCLVVGIITELMKSEYTLLMVAECMKIHYIASLKHTVSKHVNMEEKTRYIPVVLSHSPVIWITELLWIER